jgi:hypothetical protein
VALSGAGAATRQGAMIVQRSVRRDSIMSGDERARRGATVGNIRYGFL